MNQAGAASKTGSGPDVAELVERVERLEEQVAAMRERMNMTRIHAILSDAPHIPK